MRKGSYLLAFLILLALDAALKGWIYVALPPYSAISVFHGVLGIDFSIVRVLNTGAAWSAFASYPHILIYLRLAIFLALAVYALFLNRERWRNFPFLLILTGAFGNILDYFLYGAVVDMFAFNLWGYRYPVFNIADSLVCIGVLYMVLRSLFTKKSHENRATAS